MPSKFSCPHVKQTASRALTYEDAQCPTVQYGQVRLGNNDGETPLDLTACLAALCFDKRPQQASSSDIHTYSRCIFLRKEKINWSNGHCHWLTATTANCKPVMCKHR